MRQDNTMNASGNSPRPLLPQYHREREIGHGEYGVVYLAKYLGTYYALKVVRHPDNTDASRADAYARELRGVRLVMGLPKIDGLVRIHDFAQRPDDSEFAYVMDLADPEREEVGPFDDNYRPRTLASVIDAEVALPLRECLDIGISLATVLSELQRNHVIHRDVKPANIVFIKGKAVLADVGLAADVRDASSIVGTPGYAPPERQGSPAGDVFSLGKTLYRISTGRQPGEEGLPPCIEADVDEPFFWKWMLILSKATARDPNQRYRSAKGFLRDLQRLRFLTSPAKRIVRQALIAFLVVGVILPALWELPLARACSQLSPGELKNTILPYPYSLVKPLMILRSRSRQAAEERQRQIEHRQEEEQEKKMRVERERQRKAEEERKRKEEERRRAEERRETEERQKAEERRRAVEQQKAEEELLAKAIRKAEEQCRLAERQAEERRKAEERRLAAERKAEEKRKAQEEQERKEEELRQRLEREWRETLQKERKARTERIRQKAARDQQERELLAREITGAIVSLLRPASPLDAAKVSLSYAQVLGVAREYLVHFLDWANLNPDIHPEVWQYYLDRRPIPPPYDVLRPLLVSSNAPPYPYDVLDSYVKMFMLDESLGEVKTIDWSDWSDDEFETGTLRAHLLLPMHRHKRADWNRPRRVTLTGNPFLSVEERIKKELEEKKTSEERNLDWQIHMRTPLADIIGEDSDD